MYFVKVFIITHELLKYKYYLCMSVLRKFEIEKKRMINGKKGEEDVGLALLACVFLRSLKAVFILILHD